MKIQLKTNLSVWTQFFFFFFLEDGVENKKKKLWNKFHFCCSSLIWEHVWSSILWYLFPVFPYFSLPRWKGANQVHSPRKQSHELLIKTVNKKKPSVRFIHRNCYEGKQLVHVCFFVFLKQFLHTELVCSNLRLDFSNLLA